MSASNTVTFFEFVLSEQQSLAIDIVYRRVKQYVGLTYLSTVEEYMLMGYQSIAVGIFYATIWD